MDGLLHRNQNVRIRKEKNRRKQFMFIILILLLLTAFVAGLLFWNAYHTHRYQGLEVMKSTDRTDGNSVSYQYFNGNILKYSKDGASVMDATGKAYWNGGYEMNNPAVDYCGDFVAIADIDGKDCYVYNGKDSGVKVENDLPILQVRVAAQGVVALLLEENKSNIICLLNPYASSDKRLVEIPTNVQTDGYPVDMALSPDATSLVAVYVSMVNGVMESKLVFYNFSDVGQEKNHLVGGKTFQKEVLAKVEFLDNDSVCVFREKGFTIFKNMKQPEEFRTEDFEKEIKSALFEKGLVGFIFEENDEEGKNQILLYNEQGKAILDKTFAYHYDKAFLQGGEVILHTSQDCLVLRKNGREKLNYTFEHPFRYFLKSKNRNRYYVIDEMEIKELKLAEDKNA